MKNMWKYILIGLGTVILEWILLGVFPTWFNGMGELGGLIIGAGFFLTVWGRGIFCTICVQVKYRFFDAHTFPL